VYQSIIEWQIRERADVASFQQTSGELRDFPAPVRAQNSFPKALC
jgi:hypothetical protein